MEKITKKYTNGDITVVWKPRLCVHSAICFTELPKVFIPYERPWVNMKAASTEEIMDTVSRCPTQALSYYYNNEKEVTKKTDKSSAEISLIKNGPIVVKGSFKLTDTDGNEIVTENNAVLCRCGYTKNSPFCDGSHVMHDFNIDK